MTSPVDLDALERLEKEATPGPWEWQNGCSWWRIGTRFGNGDVMQPVLHQYDKHPDLSFKNQADRDLLVALRNSFPALIQELRDARGRAEKAERELEKERTDHERSLEQRDDAEECIGDIYFMMTGRSPEWSGSTIPGEGFGYAACLAELTEVRQVLGAAAANSQSQLLASNERVKALEGAVAYLLSTGNTADGQRPRIVDLCFTAFLRARDPNPDDGGATDWFNDTKPIIDAAIEKWRAALSPAQQETK